jgi:hypothetical protein
VNPVASLLRRRRYDRAIRDHHEAIGARVAAELKCAPRPLPGGAEAAWLFGSLREAPKSSSDGRRGR